MEKIHSRDLICCYARKIIVTEVLKDGFDAQWHIDVLPNQNVIVIDRILFSLRGDKDKIVVYCGQMKLNNRTKEQLEN